MAEFASVHKLCIYGDPEVVYRVMCLHSVMQTSCVSHITLHRRHTACMFVQGGLQERGCSSCVYAG
jgi:hypothetical protein